VTENATKKSFMPIAITIMGQIYEFLAKNFTFKNGFLSRCLLLVIFPEFHFRVVLELEQS
jgi:hypothetical protein